MRILTLILATLLFFFSACCKQSESSDKTDKKIIIRFSHIAGKNTPKGIGANLLKRAVEDNTLLHGKIKVEVYPNSLLYDDDKKLMEALSKNEIQLAAPSISKLVEYNPKLTVFDLPYLFENVEAVSRFQAEMDKTGKLFKTDSSQNKLLSAPNQNQSAPNQNQGDNFLVLAHWHGGMKQLSANKELKKLADVSGLKIRIQLPISLGESPLSSVLEATLKAWGADPKSKSFGDVYKNLKNGNLDGQENIWSNNWAEKYYEVQDHFYETNHGYLGYLLITNTQFWQNLPSDDVRTSLTTVIQNVTVQVNELAVEMNKEAHQKIIDIGDKDKNGQPKIVELTPDKFGCDKAKEVLEQFKVEIGQEVIEAAKQANQNHQAKCP